MIHLDFMKKVLAILIVFFLISSNDDYIVYEVAKEHSDSVEMQVSDMIASSNSNIHEKEYMYSLLPLAKKKIFDTLQSHMKVKNYFVFKVVFFQDYPLGISMFNYIYYIYPEEDIMEEETPTI